MNRILDILIPRFITERVALIDANGQLEIACAQGRPPKPTDNALIRTLCAQIREQNQEIAALRIANTDLRQRLEKAEGGQSSSLPQAIQQTTQPLATTEEKQ
ncbi:hypothetical protein ACRS64_02090 [Pseudomonas aeruginosa]|uniref:hypothetical protein n=1 Tax=Pseudomonas aeruginosa TaxID=287 RepID=UPI003DA794F9